MISQARFRQTDEEYFQVARHMRECARNDFCSVDFTSSTEGDNDVAISCCNGEADIARLKNDTEHLPARQEPSCTCATGRHR